MLDEWQIAEITAKVADGQWSDVHLRRVISEPTTDSQGDDALSITLVLEPNDVGRLTGDNVIDMLVAVQNKLRSEGEERLPIIHYATEQELAIGLSEDDV